MATYSSILAWRIPWSEEPGGRQSMGSQKSQTQLSDSLSLSLSITHKTQLLESLSCQVLYFSLCWEDLQTSYTWDLQLNGLLTSCCAVYREQLTNWSVAHLFILCVFSRAQVLIKKEFNLCRGPAPADPGYSKERWQRRGSGNNCLITR